MPTKKKITRREEKKLPEITGIENILNLEKREKLTKEIRTKVKTKLSKQKKYQPIAGIILAIDLSKTKPAFCVGTDKGEILFCTSLPGLTKNKALEILELTETIINKYKPELVIFEEVFAQFIKAASKLLIYKGLVYNILLNLEIPTYELSNSVAKALFKVEREIIKKPRKNSKDKTVKKEIKLVACKTKEEVFAKANEFLGLDLDFNEFNDEIDAILLWMVYLDSKKTNLTLID